MPSNLRRYQRTGDLHFITFSCYRQPKLGTPAARALFERSLEQTRHTYGLYVAGYSSFGIAIDRKHAFKWLFHQEKATSHCAQKV